MEIFEDIPTHVKYSENYQVNRVGEVYSKRSGIILKPYIRKTYPAVSLTDKGKKIIVDVHRLIALTFVEGCRDGLVVNHIDNNPMNNHFTNLEWVTQGQNVRHAIGIGAWDTVRTYKTNKGLITKKIEVVNK